MASIYSCSSLAGLVSSKRRWQRPPNSPAMPKFRQIDLACPIWRYPFGSGGNRVTTALARPASRSALTMSRMKSRPISAPAASPDVMPYGLFLIAHLPERHVACGLCAKFGLAAQAASHLDQFARWPRKKPGVGRAFVVVLDVNPATAIRYFAEVPPWLPPLPPAPRPVEAPMLLPILPF